MIDYRILTGFVDPWGSKVADIEKQVNEHLNRGYELCGNPMHIKDNEFSQAMIRKEKEK